MDKATSVVAALNAGKQPSQSQTNAWVEKFLQSPLFQVEKSAGEGELSQNGQKLARDLRGVLEAYKAYGARKNSENLVQEALWHLNQADLSSSSLDIDVSIDSEEASNDYRAVATSLRTSLQIFWDSAATEGSGVFSDFASFTRLSLADAADAVSEKAGDAAQKLRHVEDEVQSGDRDSIGIPEKAKEQWRNADARETFETSMDTAKVGGSAAIGAAQSAGGKAAELKDRSRTRLQAAASSMAKRSREDPEYRKSLDTLFGLIQKWLKVTGDSAVDAAESTSLGSFIHDPTPEQHLIHAIRCIGKLTENIAGGKSLDDLYSALRSCVVDIRNDPDLQRWTDDYLAYMRRSLENVGDNDSEELTQTRQDLRQRWNELIDSNSNKGSQWKEDFGLLRKEFRAFQERLERDPDLQAVRKAHAQLGTDLEETFIDAAAAGLQAAISGSSWIWTDLFNVYLPRFFSLLKSVPIPRTEYADNETEFVLENLDISSLALLPGHVYIRNITDIDISAPSGEESTTAVGALTHVHLKGVQLQLSQLSFYYRDKTASVGPAEFTGLAEITLPEAGLDVDVKVRSIPSTSAGLAERSAKRRFLHIERVDVNVSDDVTVRVAESNHPVLIAVFRPLLVTRLRSALQTVLSEHIRTMLDGADELAWDTSSRAEVFEDAGLARGPALAAAWWSELGRLRRMQGGLFAGWRATGSGLVRGVGGGQVALGAEPQVLGPEKHGPKGTLSQPLKDRAREAAPDVDININADSAEEGARETVTQAKEGAKAGLQKVRTFKEMVAEKQHKEESRPGWSSSAFDV
ncbi:hypothetical protein BC834DRAFT_942513 [Gloeopeniophorella convolvens]|nr:hypothetical protein BC834DRAFT_942513 [Gloeopeniophorella convolvens]